jgi:hypothetical protein
MLPGAAFMMRKMRRLSASRTNRDCSKRRTRYAANAPPHPTLTPERLWTAQAEAEKGIERDPLLLRDGLLVTD